MTAPAPNCATRRNSSLLTQIRNSNNSAQLPNRPLFFRRQQQKNQKLTNQNQQQRYTSKCTTLKNVLRAVSSSPGHYHQNQSNNSTDSANSNKNNDDNNTANYSAPNPINSGGYSSSGPNNAASNINKRGGGGEMTFSNLFKAKLYSSFPNLHNSVLINNALFRKHSGTGGGSNKFLVMMSTRTKEYDGNDENVQKVLKAVASDHVVQTSSADNKIRRTVFLERSDQEKFGFTLQSYSFRHRHRSGQVERITYVDYVALGSPAFRAGLRAGDVILAINGKNIQNYGHKMLVQYIVEKTSLRMVVLFENCVNRIDLCTKAVKLKKLLSDKNFELKILNMQEDRLLKGLPLLTDDDVLLTLRTPATTPSPTTATFSIQSALFDAGKVVATNGQEENDRQYSSSVVTVNENDVDVCGCFTTTGDGDTNSNFHSEDSDSIDSSVAECSESQAYSNPNFEPTRSMIEENAEEEIRRAEENIRNKNSAAVASIDAGISAHAESSAIINNEAASVKFVVGGSGSESNSSASTSCSNFSCVYVNVTTCTPPRCDTVDSSRGATRNLDTVVYRTSSTTNRKRSSSLPSSTNRKRAAECLNFQPMKLSGEQKDTVIVVDSVEHSRDQKLLLSNQRQQNTKFSGEENNFKNVIGCDVAAAEQSRDQKSYVKCVDQSNRSFSECDGVVDDQSDCSAAAGAQIVDQSNLIEKNSVTANGAGVAKSCDQKIINNEGERSDDDSLRVGNDNVVIMRL